MKLQIFMTKIPRLDSNHTCLVTITLDSALKKDDILSTSISKRVQIYCKKVFRHTHDSLSDFSYSSYKSDKE